MTKVANTAPAATAAGAPKNKTEAPVAEMPKAEEKPAAPVIAPHSTEKKYDYRGREFVDLRAASGPMAEHKKGQTATHKYAKVHAAAEAAGSPCKLGWKYATMIFTLNKTSRDRKEGTAYGIIQSVVREAGENGISGMEMVPLVRARAKSNTRTDFGAGQVPPIGWAEGWIDGAVNESIIKTVKGKTLELADTPAPTEEVAEPEKQAKAA
jgi:hypothetical protein